MKFSLKNLELVLLVAEYGSVTRAAKHLGTTQSFISKQIARLEEDWGDRLFERTGRGMRLTSFTQGILPEIKALLGHAQQLDNSIKESAGIPAGNVRVGIVPSMSRWLLPRLVADIQERAPAVRLMVLESFTGVLEEKLVTGELDVAVMNRYRAQPDDEDLLGYVATMLIGKAGSQVLADEEVDFARIDGLPLVVPPTPDGMRVFLMREAQARQININVYLEVNTISALIRIAASGKGYTLLPLLAVSDDVRSGKLAASRIVNPEMIRTISMGLNRHQTLSRAARLVAQRVRHLMKELLE